MDGTPCFTRGISVSLLSQHILREYAEDSGWKETCGGLGRVDERSTSTFAKARCSNESYSFENCFGGGLPLRKYMAPAPVDLKVEYVEYLSASHLSHIVNDNEDLIHAPPPRGAKAHPYGQRQGRPDVHHLPHRFSGCA